ncbi:MAG: four helix bundle protein [Bacteroidota bacterium]|jgi:four helix bundle protein
MSEPDHIYATLSTSQLQKLSVDFSRAVRRLFLNLVRFSPDERSACVQLYRAGSSVGANVREAKYAESPKDFIHKLKIAEKELGEFYYWLGFLCSRPSVIDQEARKEVELLASSVGKLLTATIVAMKRKHST